MAYRIHGIVQIYRPSLLTIMLSKKEALAKVPDTHNWADFIPKTGKRPNLVVNSVLALFEEQKKNFTLK